MSRHKKRSGQPRERHGGGLVRVEQENLNGSWDLWMDKNKSKDDRKDPQSQRPSEKSERKETGSRWAFIDDERREEPAAANVKSYNSERNYNNRRRAPDVAPAPSPNKSDIDIPIDTRYGDEDTRSTISTSSSSSAVDEHAIALSFGQGPAAAALDDVSSNPLGFGIIVYDLETIHNAERGTYLARGIHECSYDEQMTWKMASNIIEFAAVEVVTGRQICVQCRPEFGWSEVKSLAARLFAEDHGHDKIVKDENLGYFPEVWTRDILPYLQKCAGPSNSIAMIAHNGDNFDSFILEKELRRHGLLEGLPLVKHFDPVRSLKRAFGQEFGLGGMLTLGSLHGRHVPNPTADQPLHQAFADTWMLLEVITHWVVLRALLAAEIAASFANADMVEYVCNTIISSFAELVKSADASKNGPVAVEVQSASAHPAAHHCAALESQFSQPSHVFRVASETAAHPANTAASDTAPATRGGSAGSEETPHPSAAARAERPDKANRPEVADWLTTKDLQDLPPAERRRLIREQGQRERAMEKERAEEAAVREAEQAKRGGNGEKAPWDDDAQGHRRRRHRGGVKRIGKGETDRDRGLPSGDQPRDLDRPAQPRAEAASATSSGSGVQFQ